MAGCICRDHGWMGNFVLVLTGIIQLYPLPFVDTVRSDLCEHLPTCGSAAIVRFQYPNMEKRVRLAGFTRISARK